MDCEILGFLDFRISFFFNLLSLTPDFIFGRWMFGTLDCILIIKVFANLNLNIRLLDSTILDL